MRRPPLGATLIVALAVAAMVALGVWQLQRKGQKEAAIARYAANIHRAPATFPANATGDDLLFRRSSVMCLRVVGWSRESGRAANGLRGWRVIARCATGAEGPGALVQLGVARAPDATPAWRGGPVRGYISHAPDHRALIAALFDRTPKALMLVATDPPPGLEPNPPADLSAVPNNHLAYAVQWFLFAAIALAIYALALRRRS